MSKTIYLVRHGETDFNTDPVPRVRGRVDVPLNAQGEAHARQAAECLRDVALGRIYCSAVNRALQTAELVHEAQKGPCELVVDELVIDISWGDWEGKTYLEAFGDEQASTFFNAPEKLVIPNGESFYQVMDRLRRFLVRFYQSDEQVCCIVSHGAVFNLLGCLITEAPVRKFWSFYMGGCGVSKIIMTGIDNFTIGFWNSMTHIK
ncbi:6-phosphofructo-2-kinase / Fructose-2,6-bisphosphate 2-phosphatase [Spironucleus salmonicida]|uniref:6-phosphofructo-2-kinase / Fructose-2,6-bisphosphate 2-phosphatase n=1 Tax=Spironucleus salmonicida TaxID=348837 RepID=A0A9P8LMV0_9EUKA|nr:6-phosphofructo-2-kinase / Fructose-2,6-bisphosphate 2-phosphatase [Spironucleus salmonicida]